MPAEAQKEHQSAVPLRRGLHIAWPTLVWPGRRHSMQNSAWSVTRALYVAEERYQQSL